MRDGSGGPVFATILRNMEERDYLGANALVDQFLQRASKSDDLISQDRYRGCRV
jgi:hypothetical protein